MHSGQLCGERQRGYGDLFVAENVEEMSTLDLTPDHLEWIKQIGGAVKQITVRTATLDSLLAEAAFPEIQFITIDVEGHEMAVLEGFTLEAHKPRIVIIEDNSVSGDPRASVASTSGSTCPNTDTCISVAPVSTSGMPTSPMSSSCEPDEIRRFDGQRRASDGSADATFRQPHGHAGRGLPPGARRSSA